MNPSKGDGGTCYGDSGGPNFLGATNIVAATTITGDSVCRSTNVDYRLDTPDARASSRPTSPSLTPPGAPAPSGVDHVYVVDGHLARRARLAR